LTLRYNEKYNGMYLFDVKLGWSLTPEVDWKPTSQAYIATGGGRYVCGIYGEKVM
jgi:hypothetical protein